MLFKIFQLQILALVIGFVLTILERQIMYTENENWLFNENMSQLVEWGILAIALSLVATFS
jgi:hypothetical protein